MAHKEVEDILMSADISHGKYLTSFQRKLLLKSLQADLPEFYSQRIQIMLLADIGKSQTEICRLIKCCPATARHWIHMARSGMAHQWELSPIGRPKAVNEEYLERLQELVKNDPRNYGYSFRRWTANWLNKHLAKELGVKVSDCHIKRLLKQMGLSTRQSTKNISKNLSPEASSSQIAISDLKHKYVLEDNEVLPIHFLKLESKS